MFGIFFCLLALSACLPVQASAQVVINEVMYNPQGSDSGREWVELYNEGASDVTMTAGSGKGSWRINDGSNHTLTDPVSGTGRGSLTIPAGGYLVIANDPSDFSSGEYAGGAYSVIKSSLSLNNNGATISLVDGSGATLDSVSYLPTQGGNDDSSSLQRQSDGSWIAALPTPGAANSSTAYVAPAPPDSSASTQGATQSVASSTDQSTGAPETPPTSNSYVAPPVPSLYADAGSDRSVIVGADVEFDANAYDKTQTLLDPSTVRFMWNFGDGAVAEGDSVLHHFSYPGRYDVVLEIADNKNAAMAQLTVDAQPAALSFSLFPDGGIDIENLSGHDLDLSNWIVRQNSGTLASQFMLPQDSKILEDSSMRVSPQTLMFRASSSTMLEYPNGVLALNIGGSSATSSDSHETEQAGASSVTLATLASSPRANETTDAKAAPSMDISGDALEDQGDLDDSPVAATDSQGSAAIATSAVLETAAAASGAAANYFWWLGVGALALAAAAALAAAGYFKKGEWDIVEDSDT